MNKQALERLADRPGGEVVLTFIAGASLIGMMEAMRACTDAAAVVLERRRRRELAPATRLADLPGAPTWACADPFDLLRDLTLREEVTGHGETPPLVS